MTKIVLVNATSEVTQKVQELAKTLGVECELTTSDVVLPSQNLTCNLVAFPEPTKETPPSTLAFAEAEAITKAISSCKGNYSEAAKSLGIGRATLYRKVKEYNIQTQKVRKSA